MDLKQLQYFVVSVDSGSLKKASEILYISQPHISKTIKSLEAELQVELLVRKARGVEVTEAGRKVYEYAHRILVDSGKIQNIRESKAVSTFSIIANADSRLAELFRIFYVKELKCQVRAQYMEAGMEEVLQCIHRHAAEMGFVHVDARQMTTFEQMLRYRHLEFAEIGKAAPCLFVGPQSPLYKADYVTEKELKNIQYVQMKDEQDFMGINLIKGTEDYLYYRSHGQVLVTNSQQFMIQMLLTTKLGSIGCGLSAEANKNGRIRGIPLKGAKGNIAFGYIKRKRDGISPEGAAFAAYLKKHWEE